MNSVTDAASESRTRVWIGRFVQSLVVLFLLFDTALHLAKPAAVVEAFNRLDYPLSASVGIGMVEVLCLLAYIFPRTAILGSVLLTGLVGGAIATHVRAGSPLFEAYIFPAILAFMIWGGLWLRDARLRALFPLRGD